VLDFHVQVKRALGPVSLIASEVRALICLLYLVVTAAEVSLATTGIEMVLIGVSIRLLISAFHIIIQVHFTLVDLGGHGRQGTSQLAFLLVICE
jgi:hypothetical protein